MYDREIVAAIVEGDPAGLAAAYDRYAQGLHAYCRSMLTEPADAADAAQDTFIIASSKVWGCANPSGCGRGCTPWPATSAIAGSGPGCRRPRSMRRRK
jgi:hypothetical protein